jgi:hypothetical protein
MRHLQEALANNSDTIVRFGVRRGESNSLISVVVVRTPLNTGPGSTNPLSTSTSSFSGNVPNVHANKAGPGLSMSMSGLEAAGEGGLNAGPTAPGPTMGGSYSGTSFATPGGTYSGYNGCAMSLPSCPPVFLCSLPTPNRPHHVSLTPCFSLCLFVDERYLLVST